MEPKPTFDSQEFDPNKSAEDLLLDALEVLEVSGREPDKIVSHPALIDDEPIAPQVYRINSEQGDSVEVAGDDQGYMICYEKRAEDDQSDRQIAIFTIKDGQVNSQLLPSESNETTAKEESMHLAASVIVRSLVAQG